jgi:hypothetical protein
VNELRSYPPDERYRQFYQSTIVHDDGIVVSVSVTAPRGESVAPSPQRPDSATPYETPPAAMREGWSLSSFAELVRWFARVLGVCSPTWIPAGAAAYALGRRQVAISSLAFFLLAESIAFWVPVVEWRWLNNP